MHKDDDRRPEVRHDGEAKLPISDEELERQQAADLPDREAMSLLTPGAMVPPMPVTDGGTMHIEPTQPTPEPVTPADTLQPLPESPLGRTAN